MRKGALLIFTMLFTGLLSFGQEEIESEEKELKNIVAISFGYNYIPKGANVGEENAKGVFVPSLGFDYFHSYSPRWEFGVMFDFEFAEYIIIEKELNRDRAFIIAGIASYSLTNNINLFFGGGIEIEKNHNLGIVRLGIDYGFELENNWLIGPGFFYDIKEGYDCWSLAIALGKRF